MPTESVGEAILGPAFFDRPPLELARTLLGKIIRHYVRHPQHGGAWLSARIIETEAYDINEKGSHASLGYTPKRAGLFMPPGTIYMYYARGKASLNFSARGRGNGVLIKSGLVHVDDRSGPHSLSIMHEFNPGSSGQRADETLCAGQTLLCRSLGLKVQDWDQQQTDSSRFYIADAGLAISAIVQCPRLGIPAGRDEHLPYRFVDLANARYCTRNPLTRRSWVRDRDYWIHQVDDPAHETPATPASHPGTT